jgi:hypothetical protein
VQILEGGKILNLLGKNPLQSGRARMGATARRRNPDNGGPKAFVTDLGMMRKEKARWAGGFPPGPDAQAWLLGGGAAAKPAPVRSAGVLITALELTGNIFWIISIVPEATATRRGPKPNPGKVTAGGGHDLRTGMGFRPPAFIASSRLRFSLGPRCPESSFALIHQLDRRTNNR